MLKLIRTFLQQVIQSNNHGFLKLKFLAETVKHGNAEILGYLFECGANAGEIIGDNRDSLLHLAASYGHEDILNLLFEKGANVHARNIK